MASHQRRRSAVLSASISTRSCSGPAPSLEPRLVSGCTSRCGSRKPRLAGGCSRTSSRRASSSCVSRSSSSPTALPHDVWRRSSTTSTEPAAARAIRRASAAGSCVSSTRKPSASSRHTSLDGPRPTTSTLRPAISARRAMWRASGAMAPSPSAIVSKPHAVGRCATSSITANDERASPNALAAGATKRDASMLDRDALKALSPAIRLPLGQIDPTLMSRC